MRPKGDSRSINNRSLKRAALIPFLLLTVLRCSFQERQQLAVVLRLFLLRSLISILDVGVRAEFTLLQGRVYLRPLLEDLAVQDVLILYNFGKTGSCKRIRVLINVRLLELMGCLLRGVELPFLFVQLNELLSSLFLVLHRITEAE